MRPQREGARVDTPAAFPYVARTLAEYAVCSACWARDRTILVVMIRAGNAPILWYPNRIGRR